MTHTAHRYGTRDNLKNDFIYYARASRYVNREGCGPKLKKILDIFISEKPVNYSFTSASSSSAAGLDLEKEIHEIEKAFGVSCVFSSRDAMKAALKKLKEADTGISVVISGLIDEITDVAAELDLKPHTALLSLGILGKKSLLPEEKVLEMTTMCGHGLVATQLSETVLKKVREGAMTPEQGAQILAQPCPCGVFNLDRCKILFEEQAGVQSKNKKQ
jgi:hypothetical protein